MSNDMVCFTNRRAAANRSPKRMSGVLDSNPAIGDSGFSKARKAAPGYDIQGLFHEWVSW
jgi:hypothetical protein